MSLLDAGDRLALYSVVVNPFCGTGVGESG